MKLCPCKRKFIREEVESIACYGSCTEAVTKIVESDCLCEPGKSSCSEIPNNSTTCQCRYHNEDCNGEVKENGVCADCPPNCLEKQPQSPCEHEFHKDEMLTVAKIANYKNGVGDPVLLTNKMWYWSCEKCGLVTCKNPNE